MSKKKMQSWQAKYSAKQQEQARQNNAEARRNGLTVQQYNQQKADKTDTAGAAQPMPETAPAAAPLAAEPAQPNEENQKLLAEKQALEEKCRQLEEKCQQLEKDRQDVEQKKKAVEEESRRLKDLEGELNRQKLLQDGQQVSLDAQKQLLDDKAKQIVKQQTALLEQQKKWNEKYAAEKMTLFQLQNEAEAELAAKRSAWMEQIRTETSAARAEQMRQVDSDVKAYEKSRRDDLDEEIKNSRTEKNAELEKELTALRTAWETQKAEEQEALEAERTENEKARQKLDEREEMLDQRQDSMDDQLDQKEQEKNCAIREKEKECQDLRTKLGSTEEKARSLEERVDAQREKLTEYQAFESTWGGKPEDLKAKLAELRAANEELKQKINDLPPKDLQQKYTELTAEKEELSARCRNLENQNEMLRKDAEELRTLRETKVEQENRIRKAELDAETAQKENVELRERLQRFLNPEAQKQDRDERIKALSVPYLTNIPVQNPVQPKDEIAWLQNIQNKCKEYGIVFPRRLLYAFHTALKIADWSSITILSGISGTGKSELPRLYSLFGGINFYSVPVQPNWDSQESMLGYFNSIDNRFEAKELLRFLVQSTRNEYTVNAEGKKLFKPASKEPWPLGQYMSIVLLDEMNLAHVEHYFAEFLSKLETRRGLEKSDVPTIDVNLGAGCEPYELPLRRNVLWVGTMNQDETTKTLSDKVLDRGITITFPTPKKLESRPEMKRLPNKVSENMLAYWTWYGWCRTARTNNKEFQAQMDKYRRVVERINEEMGKSGRAVGHRVWQSIEYYITNYPDVIAERKALLEQDAGAGSPESLAEQNASITQDGDAAKKPKRIEECDLEKKDTPLPPRLVQAMNIAFEDQLVQKIMPKLRGIEDNGSGKSQLDAIWTVLEDAGFGALKDDFEKARQYGYGEFFWNSAEYLEHDLPVSLSESQDTVDAGQTPAEAQN